jgi:hypothetical protein
MILPVGRLLAVILVSLTSFCLSQSAMARIHTAPVVIPGYRIGNATHYPISMYRLFRTNQAGEAESIPFQIDEINEWGDYVLPMGGRITANTGNGIFDKQDEIAFMGDDVGPATHPTSWPEGKPSLVFEIRQDFLEAKNSAGSMTGAVYLGIFFQSPTPLSKKRYVVFDRGNAEVTTSRYRYGFDQTNWLVARRVDMVKKGTSGESTVWEPLLDSTTFYMKADLKYFITVAANHKSINSELEAYKTGPIRTIVRVSFYYTFLKLNFELGMYTEISFFSNAVYLPAILYNPLDGKKSLNSGSGFYYGMGLKQNPDEFNIKSNMIPYKEKGFLDFFDSAPKPLDLYWVSAHGLNRMMYMEISPSKEMKAAGAIPMLYKEAVSGLKIRKRGSDTPSKLGKSPVNLGLYFDMTKFSEGDHIMAFKLFFENTDDPKRLESFKTLNRWDISANRIRENIPVPVK